MGRTGQSVTWRDVVGWEGLYEVSDDGRVRSWNGGRWGRRSVPLMVALGRTRDGYITAHLGKHKLVTVHRLVCAAFNGPCPDGMECAHADGNPANNVPPNLQWKTPVANGADKVLHGTSGRGEQHRDAKLTEAQVIEIRRRRRAGERNMDVAAAFGVSPQSISHIASGKKWRHVPMEA